MDNMGETYKDISWLEDVQLQEGFPLSRLSDLLLADHSLRFKLRQLQAVILRGRGPLASEP